MQILQVQVANLPGGRVSRSIPLSQTGGGGVSFHCSTSAIVSVMHDQVVQQIDSSAFRWLCRNGFPGAAPRRFPGVRRLITWIGF